MKPEDIRDTIIQALDDAKGVDITAMDVKTLTTITDYMIICTGKSTRHLKSMADAVVQKAKEHQLKFIRREGEPSDEWVLVDLADIVVHLMLAHTREFYALEDLWEPIETLRHDKTSHSS